jgi:hypothetical protein
MEQNLDNKIELKDKFISLYNKNKSKIYLLIAFVFIAIISITVFKIIEERKNIAISEKYIKANLYLTADKINQSKVLYEEIINSENKFYSVLALNKLIEKDLEKNKEKIVSYFIKIEKLKFSKENKELLLLKKALYLIKNSSVEEGNKILNELINSNSSIKSIAKEVLIN